MMQVSIPMVFLYTLHAVHDIHKNSNGRKQCFAAQEKKIVEEMMGQQSYCTGKIQTCQKDLRGRLSNVG
jgi:hypothetical protein